MTSFAHLVNPWQLSVLGWLCCVVLEQITLHTLDATVHWLCTFVKKLPSRQGPKPVYERPIEWLDKLYLNCNSLVENAFVQILTYHLSHSSNVGRGWAALGLLNGPVALWLLLIFNDMLYAPAHRALHHPLLYRWIHKHHHRVAFPKRGQVDARNEHPVEQIMAMSLWYIAAQLVSKLTGIHAVVMVIHFAITTLLALFNHTGADLQLSVCGIDWAVRAHEMHHRKPDKNFGQFVMWFDKLMGTYVPYSSHSD